MGEESFSELEYEEAVADSSPIKDKRRGRPWLLPLLLGTGLGVGIAFGGMRVLSNRPTPKAPVATNPSGQNINPSMTVTVARAEVTRVARTLNATGTVAAQDLTPVLPQTNGLQIKDIKVDVGEQVKAGQVMAVLDDSVLQDQIRQAKADVESKQADVASRQADLAAKQAAVASSQATVAANQAIVQQRQADLAQAKAKLEDFQRTYQRNQELAASGAISRQQLDTAATNLATAKEAVTLAEANIRSAEANVKSAEANINSAQSTVKIAAANINSAQASVKSSAAKVKQLQTQLGQTLVKAPVTGVVAEKLARVGDITGVAPQTQVGTVIGGSQKLFSIISNGKLELQALIPAVQLSQVRVGAPVQITSDADKRLSLQGRVREIEPIINQTRREATVKIDLPTTLLLKPGMFARAAITTNTTIGVAAPQKAVRPQPDGSAIVFMLSGEDKVRAQKVEIGEILNNNRMEIKRGLQAGDRIVIDGAGYIKDGDKVRTINNEQ